MDGQLPQFHLLKSNETSTDDKYAVIAVEIKLPVALTERL